MTTESICDEIKQVLSGSPDKPMVLGVCQALAVRFDQKVWCVRACVIVLTLFWSLPIIAAYVICGFLMKETEHRTRGFFAGLAILARETAEKFFAFLGGIFDSDDKANSRSRGY
jgi:phage shock protein PspC (stress-responsive transcriptional regulator)